MNGIDLAVLVLGIVTFAAVAGLLVAVWSLASTLEGIATSSPDINVQVPEPRVDLATLAQPPEPAEPERRTLYLDDTYDPTDGTIPRINVDWSPDLAEPAEPLDYVPDPTDPTDPTAA